VYLVDCLVNGGVVKAAMNPVNAKISEEKERGNSQGHIGDPTIRGSTFVK
jgi:hypothetical protein